MTTEALQQANDCAREIRELTEHLNLINHIISQGRKTNLRFYDQYSQNSMNLIDSLCPVSPSDFMRMYVAKTELRIAELANKIKLL